ncbi:unnamed protein product [Brassica oleracea]
MKLLFLVVKFYSATAFSTFIRETGDSGSFYLLHWLAFGIIFKICDQNRITKPMKSTLQAKPKKKTMEGDSTGVVLLAFLIVKQRDFVINVPHRSTEEDSNMANEPSRTRDCHLTLLSSHPSLDLENHKVRKGYCRGVDTGEDETAVAVNSNGMAHALVNVDPVRSTFFIGCQDSSIYAEQLRYSDYKNMERSIILSCLV